MIDNLARLIKFYNNKEKFFICQRFCLLQEMFRKYLEERLQNFILDSGRCKNNMALAKVQPFCKGLGIDSGVYTLNW